MILSRLIILNYISNELAKYIKNKIKIRKYKMNRKIIFKILISTTFFCQIELGHAMHDVRLSYADVFDTDIYDQSHIMPGPNHAVKRLYDLKERSLTKALGIHLGPKLGFLEDEVKRIVGHQRNTGITGIIKGIGELLTWPLKSIPCIKEYFEGFNTSMSGIHEIVKHSTQNPLVSNLYQEVIGIKSQIEGLYNGLRSETLKKEEEKYVKIKSQLSSELQNSIEEALIKARRDQNPFFQPLDFVKQALALPTTHKNLGKGVTWGSLEQRFNRDEYFNSLPDELRRNAFLSIKKAFFYSMSDDVDAMIRDNLFLYGNPGAGKTTLAKNIAQFLELPCYMVNLVSKDSVTNRSLYGSSWKLPAVSSVGLTGEVFLKAERGKYKNTVLIINDFHEILNNSSATSFFLELLDLENKKFLNDYFDASVDWSRVIVQLTSNSEIPSLPSVRAPQHAGLNQPQERENVYNLRVLLNMEDLDQIQPGELGLFCEDGKLYCKSATKQKMKITKSDNPLIGLTSAVYDRVLRNIDPLYLQAGRAQEEQGNQDAANRFYQQAFENIAPLDQEALLNHIFMKGYTREDRTSPLQERVRVIHVEDQTPEQMRPSLLSLSQRFRNIFYTQSDKTNEEFVGEVFDENPDASMRIWKRKLEEKIIELDSDNAATARAEENVNIMEEPDNTEGNNGEFKEDIFYTIQHEGRHVPNALTIIDPALNIIQQNPPLQGYNLREGDIVAKNYRGEFNKNCLFKIEKINGKYRANHNGKVFQYSDNRGLFFANPNAHYADWSIHSSPHKSNCYFLAHNHQDWRVNIDGAYEGHRWQWVTAKTGEGGPFWEQRLFTIKPYNPISSDDKYQLGKFYLENNNRGLGLQWYRLAASQGCDAATRELHAMGAL